MATPSKSHVISVEAFANQQPQWQATVESGGGIHPTFSQRVVTSELRLQSLLETALETGNSVEIFGKSEITKFPNGNLLETFVLEHVILHNTK